MIYYPQIVANTALEGFSFFITCIWALVPGYTGIAPFIAFLRELESRGGWGSTVVLFFGCRREKEDFLYRDQLLRLAGHNGTSEHGKGKDDQLRSGNGAPILSHLFCAFSRQPGVRAFRRRNAPVLYLHSKGNVFPAFSSIPRRLTGLPRIGFREFVYLPHRLGHVFYTHVSVLDLAGASVSAPGAPVFVAHMHQVHTKLVVKLREVVPARTHVFFFRSCTGIVGDR